MKVEKPFYQRPSFKSLVLGILLLGIYGYEIWYQGGIVHIPGIVLDLILLFLLIQISVATYAQFVLPIQKRGDRLKVIGRLWLHASGGHGPAIFVRNGRLVEGKGESQKRGPGLLWLDTASAVVTRTDLAYKNVLGPGVHFIDRREKIATVISLHTQSHRLGPEKDDDPFKLAKDYASEEEFRKVNERRIAVSAITRDGIEVVPNITVTFKIDATPAEEKEKGSRFGFDPEAVEKAARGEGINASTGRDEATRVAWNQLPALIAADLWREYLAKFTFNQLFRADLDALKDVPQPEAPDEDSFLPLHPLVTRSGFFARLLRRFNDSFESRLKRLIPEEESATAKPAEAHPGRRRAAEAEPHQTAAQLINQMIKARMTQLAVPVLDESGRQLEGFNHSKEFKTLREHGLKVYNVSVSNLRFNAEVENQIVQQWTTNWLENANADRSRIERLKLVYSETGRQQARREHALILSEAIKNPRDIPSAVGALLHQIQTEIRQDDRLLGQAKTEMQNIDEIIAWVESKDI